MYFASYLRSLNVASWDLACYASCYIEALTIHTLLLYEENSGCEVAQSIVRR